MRRLPFAGRPPRALVWLCALLYVLGGTFRNRSGVVLCVGEGTVQLTTAASAGGCACCVAIAAAPTVAPDVCGDGCCSHHAADLATGAPKQAHSRLALPCDCVDVPLPFDRSDAPQHLHADDDSRASDDGAALLVSAPLPPAADATLWPAATPRPPPPLLSRQAPPELRRYVVFLI